MASDSQSESGGVVSSTALLACPFCGSDADFEPHDYAKDGGKGIVFGVICNKCGASSARNYTSMKLAQERWNARKQANDQAQTRRADGVDREAD